MVSVAEMKPRWVIPVHGRISAPPPRAIDHPRVVVRHIDDVRLGRLYVDYFALAHNAHLLVRLQVASCVCTASQTLHGLDHVSFLCHERLTQLLGPLQVFNHPFKHRWKCDQGFDAGIPVAVLNRIDGGFTLEAGVRFHPPFCLHYFERIGGSNQDVRQHRVRIQRDGRQHLVNLGSGVACRRFFRGRLPQGQGEHQAQNENVEGLHERSPPSRHGWHSAFLPLLT